MASHYGELPLQWLESGRHFVVGYRTCAYVYSTGIMNQTLKSIVSMFMPTRFEELSYRKICNCPLLLIKVPSFKQSIAILTGTEICL